MIKTLEPQIPWSQHGEIVAQSDAMRHTLESAKLLSKSSEPILISGEPATGKTLLARTIHRLSERCDGPLIEISCAGLTQVLMDGELFGFSRTRCFGPSSGPEICPGGLERACHGTLLLDEISAMPIAQQNKLLAALQSGRIPKFGSDNETVEVDFRLIAITTEDLEKCSESGAFLPELYSQFAVATMPPLRERQQDIAPLVDLFLKAVAARLGEVPKHFTPETMLYLRSYSWPGNVTELQRVIELSWHRSTREVLGIEDLAFDP